MSLILGACAHEPQVFVMQTPLLSQVTSTPPKKELKRGAYIQSKWCSNDRDEQKSQQSAKERALNPAQPDMPRRRGLPAGIDKLLVRAHKEHGVDYFLNASIYRENECYLMRAYKPAE